MYWQGDSNWPLITSLFTVKISIGTPQRKYDIETEIIAMKNLMKKRINGKEVNNENYSAIKNIVIFFKTQFVTKIAKKHEDILSALYNQYIFFNFHLKICNYFKKN